MYMHLSRLARLVHRKHPLGVTCQKWFQYATLHYSQTSELNIMYIHGHLEFWTLSALITGYCIPTWFIVGATFDLFGIGCILQHFNPYLHFPSWSNLQMFPSWSSLLLLACFSPSSWFRIMSIISASAFVFCCDGPVIDISVSSSPLGGAVFISTLYLVCIAVIVLPFFRRHVFR